MVVVLIVTFMCEGNPPHLPPDCPLSPQDNFQDMMLSMDDYYVSMQNMQVPAVLGTILVPYPDL